MASIWAKNGLISERSAGDAKRRLDKLVGTFSYGKRFSHGTESLTLVVEMCGGCARLRGQAASSSGERSAAQARGKSSSMREARQRLSSLVRMLAR